MAALHGFTREQMYEARRVLEVGAAGLAAERATPDQIASMADEVASLFERMDDPLRFLNHDITFHRIVAEASGNPIVSTLVETVSALYYDRRRRTAEQASDRDLIGRRDGAPPDLPGDPRARRRSRAARHARSPRPGGGVPGAGRHGRGSQVDALRENPRAGACGQTHTPLRSARRCGDRRGRRSTARVPRATAVRKSSKTRVMRARVGDDRRRGARRRRAHARVGRSSSRASCRSIATRSSPSRISVPFDPVSSSRRE